ncbi:glutathione S-transferase family protein [Pelagerythrobacter marinus]|uniref:glutathione S-transferase family protein n=1 Tax=Pelagerythrobacter marinus TaxID=538382 RepID=UPI0020374174|nr:glutathione S-transferase family protein [Pelagerythrobacter marinus]USA40297.1 glutathione S-transferase family protein [Pelagerythrobacter marinus]WPZ05579.1 glutathione S-transferase family protein [Pelagerythrobacter marinus]
MPLNPDAAITVTAFDWVPDFARGLVRDLRVRWALEEAGLDYRVEYLPQGTQKLPRHRRRQPFGQLPTYEDGAVTLFESGAIALHIADQAPALLPEGDNARARAAQWVIAALNTVEPPLGDWSMATLFEADKPWSAPRKPAIRERIDERLGELSARLGDDEWLEGRFCVGDLTMIAVLQLVSGELADLLERYPNLAAYRARGEARPAYRRALEDQMAGFTGAPPAEWAAAQQEEEIA